MLFRHFDNMSNFKGELFYCKFIVLYEFHIVISVLSNCIKNGIKILCLFSRQIFSAVAIWRRLVYNIIKVVNYH